MYDPRTQWASFVINALKAKELQARDVNYIVRGEEVPRYCPPTPSLSVCGETRAERSESKRSRHCVRALGISRQTGSVFSRLDPRHRAVGVEQAAVTYVSGAGSHRRLS